MKSELQEAINGIHGAVAQIGEQSDKQYSELKARLDKIDEEREEAEAYADRPRAGGGRKTQADTWLNTKTGQPVHALGHDARLGDLEPNKSGVSLGRWLRAITVGDKADDRTELAEQLKSLAT